MQAVTTGNILTPTDLYEWCVTHINNVKIRFVRSEGVKNHATLQDESFSQGENKSWVQKPSLLHTH